MSSNLLRIQALMELSLMALMELIAIMGRHKEDNQETVDRHQVGPWMEESQKMPVRMKTIEGVTDCSSIILKF
jgi:hypothetical protein